MAAKRLNRTTLSIAPEVRDGLKHIARKDQTYNELFLDLIQLYNEHAKKSAEGFVLNREPQSQSQNDDDRSQATQTLPIAKEVKGL
jgi:hypothetical protein